jgi:glycosyltransferase involved in cell wall biosynthesis
LPAPPVVIHNGRHPPTTHAAPERRAAPFAFTAGRLWDEGKNLEALDRAAARLSLPVLAAGPLDGPNGSSARPAHVRTLGRLSDEAIRSHLAARPVFVSVARYEPFGLAVLEAAQAGCALVLADIPTFRELWGGVAVFVPPDDAGAIAASLEALADDEGARDRLGAAARIRARRYSVEAMADGVLAAYRTLGVGVEGEALGRATAA